jgi:hypothetical protein
MYIYSITTHIDKSVETEWIKYMQQKHIDELLETGYFTGCSMQKSIPEKSSVYSIYNLQFTVEDEDDFIAFQYDFEPDFQAEIKKRFGGKFTSKKYFYEVILEKK